MIAVSDMPHHRAPNLLIVRLYLNEKMTRDTYIINDPHVKAITTDSRIAETIPIALEVFIKSPMSLRSYTILLLILNTETATAEPKRQKIRETVVDVGRPQELYRSNRIILANITAR